ncbi:hypothetical protein ACIA5G_39045 [Amycolatopsis sp. NPDC051758]|uniref:hypothetical protein n=1 Tax=Amycolatopsis sp. NPDC051758 TaxID=3363935 RepID=UPI003795E8DD
MRTLHHLTELGDEGLARLRGLLLVRLVQAGRGRGNDGLLHLFLLPSEPLGTRFVLYETAQAFDGDVPPPKATAAATRALRAAGGDPRQLPGGDRRWAEVDPQARALYLGSGWRVASPNPRVQTTTIARLVDTTALYLTVGVDGEPLIAQVSKPYLLGDVKQRSDTVTAAGEVPFQLIDTLVQLLR